MSSVQAAAQLAENIVQATAITHNPGSTPQQRAEAVQFFEQVGARTIFGSIRQVSPSRMQ